MAAVVTLLLLLLPIAVSVASPACSAVGDDAAPRSCSVPAENAQEVPPAKGGESVGETPPPSRLVLWGNPASSCTRRVLLTLLELRLHGFEMVTVDLQKGEQKDPEYMKLQPFGKVPALRDGDFSLFESRAIARYLAEKFASEGTALLGSTVEEHAAVNVWMEAESNEFQPHAFAIAFEMVIGPRYGRDSNRTKAEEAAAKLSAVLDVYEARLIKHKYFAGDFYSLADLSHTPMMFSLSAAGFGHLLQERPSVARWWADVSGRRSWLQVLEGNF